MGRGKDFTCSPTPRPIKEAHKCSGPTFSVQSPAPSGTAWNHFKNFRSGLPSKIIAHYRPKRIGAQDKIDETRKEEVKYINKRCKEEEERRNGEEKVNEKKFRQKGEKSKLEQNNWWS